MKTIRYQVEINAPVAHVYKTMLGLDNKNTYNAWTTAFNPTSTYEGSWQEGSKILFIGTDENGNKGGMISRIVKHQPNQFVSIEHYGLLENDTEILEGPKVEAWAGGHENYSFSEQDGITTVTIELDTVEDYLDFFNTTYPKALELLKSICTT